MTTNGKCAYCGGPLPRPRTRRRRYCDNACRQAAYRRRRRMRPPRDLHTYMRDVDEARSRAESAQAGETLKTPGRGEKGVFYPPVRLSERLYGSVP
jgi:hypothetical protein